MADGWATAESLDSRSGASGGHRLPRGGLLLLVAIAAVVRIVAFAQLGSGPSRAAHTWDQSDMHFFDRLATRIAHGDVLLDGSFHPIEHRWRQEVARNYLRAHPDEAAELAAMSPDARGAEYALWSRWLGPKRYYQEPLYTYLVAGTRKLFGPDVRAVFTWQALLGIATVLLVAATTARWFGTAAGLVAGALAVAYAPLLFYEFALLRASVLAFAGIALVFVGGRALESDRPARWLAAGLAFGLALLLKTVFAPIGLGLLLHVLWRNRRSPARAFRLGGAFAAATSVCLAPVVVRNMVVGAPPFAVASPGLANPFTGLAAGADVGYGESVHDFGSYARIMHSSRGELLPALRETFRTHDSWGAFAVMMGRKVLHVWHWYEIPNNLNFQLAERQAPVLRFLPVRFVAVAPLALVGLALWGRRHRRTWLLTLALAGSVAVLVVFAHNSRHRIGMIPLLLPFAAHAMVQVAGWLRERRFLPAALSIAATGALAFGMAQPLPAGTPVIRPSDYAVALNTFYFPDAQTAAGRGDWDAAARLMREAIRLGPDLARNPAPPEWLPTGETRALAALYVNAHLACASYLEQGGHPADAGPHRDLAARLTRSYLTGPG